MTFAIKEIRLEGNWRYGWALDLHTLSSIPRSGGGFDTDRTPVGDLLYHLKYYLDRSKSEPLAEIVAGFLRSRLVFPFLAAIIPVPPSNTSRPFQPVQELAIQIGQKTGLPCPLDYLIKVNPTEPLKGIEDPAKRKEQLKDAFGVQGTALAGKYVVVFDDIYRSGETLRAITDVLHNQGRISRVYVLTVTKTRAKR
jgi:competence protein ComFC